MVDPQLENGFTRIANEILEALARTKLNTQESRIVYAILRKTYGFGKKADWISNSQLELITGIHRAHCAHTVTRLKQRNIVAKTGNKIQFNKLYNSWLELPKQVTKQATVDLLPKQAQGVAQTGNLVLLKQADTKETSTKETIQKKYMCKASFDTFWSSYPVKKNKKKAAAMFKRLNKNLLPIILKAIESQSKTEQWRDGIIPHPTTWLNGERWADELEGGVKEKASTQPDDLLKVALAYNPKKND